MKIELQSNQRLWLTSDTHYHHKNICRGVTSWRTKDGNVPEKQTRDFATLEDMDNTIVENINDVVSENDVLIHLGDWSFGGFEYVEEFRSKINCKNVHLILGNHDHHVERNKHNVRSLFSSVHQYLTLEVKLSQPRVSNDFYKFVLMHYPLCSWNGMNDGVFHLFGHVHLPKDKARMNGRSMDVGMDGNDLMPHEIRDVIRTLSGRPVQHNVLPYDHHEERLINQH